MIRVCSRRAATPSSRSATTTSRPSRRPTAADNRSTVAISACWQQRRATGNRPSSSQTTPVKLDTRPPFLSPPPGRAGITPRLTTPGDHPLPASLPRRDTTRPGTRPERRSRRSTRHHHHPGVTRPGPRRRPKPGGPTPPRRRRPRRPAGPGRPARQARRRVPTSRGSNSTRPWLPTTRRHARHHQTRPPRPVGTEPQRHHRPTPGARRRLLALQQGIDTTTAGCRLIFHMLAASPRSSTTSWVERTRDGLAAARARGRRGETRK